MEVNFFEEEKYILAKKKVKKIKDFYKHFTVYIITNVFLSSVIIFGLMQDNGDGFAKAFSNFGVYSTWLFWGIGVFFHAVGTFGFGNLFSKKWEEDKIKELMKKEEEKQKRMFN